jgi:hypothetical protein
MYTLNQQDFCTDNIVQNPDNQVTNNNSFITIEAFDPIKKCVTVKHLPSD